jgi:hypothetical protein
MDKLVAAIQKCGLTLSIWRNLSNVDLRGQPHILADLLPAKETMVPIR